MMIRAGAQKHSMTAGDLRKGLYEDGVPPIENPTGAILRRGVSSSDAAIAQPVILFDNEAQQVFVL